jgi:hypothetical protein
MNTKISKYAGVARQAEAALGSRIQVQGKSVETFGAESHIRGVGRPSLGFNSPVSFTHTSGVGAFEVIKLGDATGAVASQASYAAITEYKSGTPYTNAVLNDLLRNGMEVGLVNYEVGTSAQFNSAIDYASINHGGSFATRPIQNTVLLSKRNTQQNALLLTLDFSGQGIVLDVFNALFITCAADSTITQWTMLPTAVVQ